jgi:TPP-dependent 2-oxoacid decarboxylase
MHKQLIAGAAAAMLIAGGGAEYWAHGASMKNAQRAACESVKASLAPVSAEAAKTAAQVVALRAKHISSQDQQMILADLSEARANVQMQSLALQHPECYSAADINAAKGALSAAQGRVALEESRLS